MARETKFKTHTPNYPGWLDSPIVQGSFVAVQLWPERAVEGKKGELVAAGKVSNALTSKWSMKVKGRKAKLKDGTVVRRYVHFTPEELARLEEIRQEFYPHLPAD